MWDGNTLEGILIFWILISVMDGLQSDLPKNTIPVCHARYGEDVGHWGRLMGRVEGKSSTETFSRADLQDICAWDQALRITTRPPKLL